MTKREKTWYIIKSLNRLSPVLLKLVAQSAKDAVDPELTAKQREVAFSDVAELTRSGKSQ